MNCFPNEHCHGWIVFCWSLPYIKCNSRIKSRHFTQYDKSEKICSTKQFFGIYYFKSKYVIKFSISCFHDFALFFIILAHCILTNNGRARDRDWERERVLRVNVRADEPTIAKPISGHVHIKQWHYSSMSCPTYLFLTISHTKSWFVCTYFIVRPPQEILIQIIQIIKSIYSQIFDLILKKREARKP